MSGAHSRTPHDRRPGSYLQWAEKNDRVVGHTDGRAIAAASGDWRRAVDAHGIAQAVLIARDNDTRAAQHSGARATRDAGAARRRRRPRTGHRRGRRPDRLPPQRPPRRHQINRRHGRHGARDAPAEPADRNRRRPAAHAARGLVVAPEHVVHPRVASRCPVASAGGGSQAAITSSVPAWVRWLRRRRSMRATLRGVMTTPRQPRRQSSSATQMRLTPLVSPGKRPITLVRRRTSTRVHARGVCVGRYVRECPILGHPRALRPVAAPDRAPKARGFRDAITALSRACSRDRRALRVRYPLYAPEHRAATAAGRRTRPSEALVNVTRYGVSGAGEVAGLAQVKWQSR
jgi:hypothetical protein